MNITMEWTVEVRGLEFDVEVTIGDISVANSGIGAYEYWGAREFDEGEDYIEEYTIQEVLGMSDRLGKYRPLSPKMAEVVKNALYKNDRFNENLETKFWESVEMENEQPDYDSDEYRKLSKKG